MDHVTMSRSCLVRPACVVVSLICATAGQAQNVHSPDLPAAHQSSNRPNILFALADDWAYPHAGVYGDKVVRVPTFDGLARQGVLFTNAYCTAPSCTASRGSILTGQAPHRLAEGVDLWSTLPKRFPVYPDLLEQAGYVVGYTRKGWGPGNDTAGGRARNPAGPSFESFEAFLKSVPADRPFCFWFGSHDPHRAYVQGTGLKSGMRIENVVVPGFLPDTPEVRSDILDYYFAVQRFDTEVGQLLQQIRDAGRMDSTIVVMTGDNGMPFPRAKANLYGPGTRQPLSIFWPGVATPGLVVRDFVSFADFAPTFLEAAGLQVPAEMTGRSLVPLLTGKTDSHRDRVFVERERHAHARAGNASYPSRAIRTREFLYIRNLRPDRWPAGDPDLNASMGHFGDIDASPTKQVLLDRRDDPKIHRFFVLATAKRPAEELYDLKADPDELTNVAENPAYANTKSRLSAELDRWMKDTADPRLTEDDDRWDRYPYYGTGPRKRSPSRAAP
jgi:N-sulfoglucosamine sulfohydrolase